MDASRDNRLRNYKTAAQYCGLAEDYFLNQHPAGRGPEYIKPSPRRVFFSTRALDNWMESWKVVSR